MTGFLLDTNVVSETRRRQAEPRVMAFLSGIDPSMLYLSAVTVGELHKGVAMRQRTDPVNGAALSSWLQELEVQFADRILPVDSHVARQWGWLSADRPRPAIDTLIAATALAHGLTLVTRDEQDLAGIDLPIVNPWRQ